GLVPSLRLLRSTPRLYSACLLAAGWPCGFRPRGGRGGCLHPGASACAQPRPPPRAEARGRARAWASCLF
ncbi:unnamed protein product, partial [Prorocentrum cordatum]